MTLYNVSSGHTSTLRLSAGDIEYVHSGGKSFETIITSGGVEIVSAVGVSDDDKVSSGGALDIYSGGTIVSGVVSSGGELDLTAGAIVSGAAVQGGGELLLHSVVIPTGGVSAAEAMRTKTVVSGVTLSVGGIVGFDTATVNSGAVLQLLAGGVAMALAVKSGGVVEGAGEILGASNSNDGTVSGVAIGGALVTSGDLLGATLLRSGSLSAIGGTLDDLRVSGAAVIGGRAGSVIDTDVLAGGSLELLQTDEFVLSTVVSSGGAVVLQSGALSGGLVELGGVVSGSGSLGGVLSDGGLISGALGSIVVSSGGILRVLSGGAAEEIEVADGCAVSVASGGRAVDLQVDAGGRLLNDGSVIFTGSNTLAGGLSGSGVIVQKSGGVLVQSADAAKLAGEAVISGGVIELAATTGLGTASIEFAAAGSASATLQLDHAPANGTRFAEILTNFDAAADALVLRSRAFVSGATAKLIGQTLVLTDGAYKVDFTLHGATATTYVVTSDGSGGTLIAAGAGAAHFAQHLAAFGGGDAAVAGTTSAHVGAAGQAALVMTRSAGVHV